MQSSPLVTPRIEPKSIFIYQQGPDCLFDATKVFGIMVGTKEPAMMTLPIQVQFTFEKLSREIDATDNIKALRTACKQLAALFYTERELSRRFAAQLDEKLKLEHELALRAAQNRVSGFPENPAS